MTSFPNDFVFGAATAAFQVEGANHVDGRGPSVWDTFSQQPGAIDNDDLAEYGTDHYYRLEEDLDLMAWMGLKAYRFSLSWSRIFPDGVGKTNQAGLDFYDRLVDGLHKRGITPYVTLFHWDLPQALQDAYGGWVSRQCAVDFAAYSAFVASHFGDRVKHYFTINEFWNVIEAGYQFGWKAPGLTCSAQEAVMPRHHILLAHGLAAQAIREHGPTDVQIGVAEAFSPPVPLIPDEAGCQAAVAAAGDSLYLRPILKGEYTAGYFTKHESNLPKGWQDDMTTISSPMDIVGINSYYPRYVMPAGNDSGYRTVEPDSSHPTADIDWMKVDPQIGYWGPRSIAEAYGVDNIVFSESGCCSADKLNAQGNVEDTSRVMLIHNILQQCERAIAEGYPLKGYFAWSFIDNFEWCEGFSKRFGLVYVNYQTKKRTPKLSAEFYKSFIQQNQ